MRRAKDGIVTLLNWRMRGTGLSPRGSRNSRTRSLRSQMASTTTGSTACPSSCSGSGHGRWGHRRSTPTRTRSASGPLAEIGIGNGTTFVFGELVSCLRSMRRRMCRGAVGACAFGIDDHTQLIIDQVVGIVGKERSHVFFATQAASGSVSEIALGRPSFLALVQRSSSARSRSSTAKYSRTARDARSRSGRAVAWSPNARFAWFTSARIRLASFRHNNALPQPRCSGKHGRLLR